MHIHTPVTELNISDGALDRRQGIPQNKIEKKKCICNYCSLSKYLLKVYPEPGHALGAEERGCTKPTEPLPSWHLYSNENIRHGT